MHIHSPLLPIIALYAKTAVTRMHLEKIPSECIMDQVALLNFQNKFSHCLPLTCLKRIKCVSVSFRILPIAELTNTNRMGSFPPCSTMFVL